MSGKAQLTQQIQRATKWSLLTEMIVKIISPVSNMILARLLAPEEFGVLATVTMVISFAEIFVESGFQKYIIQHKFQNEEQEYKYLCVAFWTNLGFSMLLWALIALFNKQIATLVGNAGLGYLLVISGIMLPVYAVIGVQSCIIKKRLEFRKLLPARVVAAIIPLFVTVPLAAIGFSYWSLIIGNILGLITRMVLLFVTGRFVPAFYFSRAKLVEMLRVGIWTILDALAVWGTAWVDTFFVGFFMSTYYLGLYKTSSSMVSMLFGIVTAAIMPVLFSSLSRLADKKDEMQEVFLTFQRWLILLLLPIGVGIFLYQALATDLFLGRTWAETAPIIGIIALTTAFRLCFVSIYSELFRASGKFNVPLLIQCLDLLILAPLCYFTIREGFWIFTYARSIARLLMMIPCIVIARVLCGVSISRTLKQCIAPTVACIGMSICAIFFIHLTDKACLLICSIVLCALVYMLIVCMFKEERNLLTGYFRHAVIRRKK